MESAQNCYDYYYSILKKLLSLIGQWPYQERKTRLCRLSLLTVISTSIIVPQINELIQCGGDTQCIMLVIPLFMVPLIILVKLYTCQFNNSKIKRLTDHLRSDWEQLISAEEYEIMKTYAANARLISMTYSLMLYILAGLFVSVSLIPHVVNVILPQNKSWPIIMPFGGYYFVDAEKYFFYIFFHVLISIEITLTIAASHDCILLVYIEHVCSVFAVAGLRFGIVCDDRDDAMDIRLSNIYDRKIALSVYAHWQAIRSAELLEKLFGVSFIVQLLIITVGMSITLLQITVQLDEIMEAMRHVGFAIAQLLHLFCFSLQGQRLIDHSVQIRDKIYNFSWYNIPVTSQRLLLYVMRRSMQPNFLSAGKIYVFSLKSFATVLQSSMSYFTVLASV